ncbi:MAG: hypothetical protein KatS3mg043_0462 [Rhodothermaceae bacterium]|nr:MAG: hypothetical protein KatS3mg043_0462 [Rhodothermaceae bacterium]
MRRAGILLLVGAGWATIGLLQVVAQRPTFGGTDGPSQALTVGYYGVRFSFDGTVRPDPTFDFDGPVAGISYARPNFFAALAFGEQRTEGEDRRLLDVNLMLWGEVEPFVFEEGSRVRFFVPVALHSGFRRVSRPGTDDGLLDAFEFSVIGLGGGVGFRLAGPRVVLEARALPAVGLALRSFGDTTGLSTFVDADVQVHLARLAGRFGLTAGAGYRRQTWNAGGSGFLANDFFDYRGSQQFFRIGANW